MCLSDECNAANLHILDPDSVSGKKLKLIDITLIFAVHERSSCRSLQHNFMPLREFIAFTKPIYSLYWIYASKTKSCPLPKNENVETPDMVDFI